MASQFNTNIELADILQAIKRQWLIIAVCLVGALAISFVMTAKTKSIYFAEANLLIKWANPTEVIIFADKGVQAGRSNSWKMNSEIELIKSYEVAERAYRLRTNKKNNLNAKDSLLVNRLKNSVVVSPVRDAEIISLGYKSTSPVEAVHMVNIFIKAYKSYRNELYFNASNEDFLASQITHSKEQMSSIQKQYESFRKNKRVVSLPEQKQNLIRQLNQTERELFDVQRIRLKQQTLLDQFKQIRSGSKELGGLPIARGNANWGNVNTLYEQLNQLRLERIKLLNEYTQEYELVRANESNIAYLRDLLKKEVDRILQIEESNLNALVSDEELLNKEAAKLRSQLQRIPELEQMDADISRDLDEYKQLYSTLLKKREEERINAANKFDPVKFEIISPALVPSKPISPNMAYNLTIAVFIGLFLGCGIAIARDFADGSIKSAKSLEDLMELPVLTEIDNLDSSRVKGTSWL